MKAIADRDFQEQVELVAGCATSAPFADSLFA